MQVLDVELTTRHTYAGYVRNHSRPLLEELAVAAVPDAAGPDVAVRPDVRRPGRRSRPTDPNRGVGGPVLGASLCDRGWGFVWAGAGRVRGCGWLMLKML
jgi:hypothetical protein